MQQNVDALLSAVGKNELTINQRIVVGMCIMIAHDWLVDHSEADKNVGELTLRTLGIERPE